MTAPLTFDQAREAFIRALPGAAFPSTSRSYVNATGQWVLRNERGFLAYVSPRGRVLDHRFQGAPR